MAYPIPAKESERLDDLRSLKILDTPSEERFDRITRMAARLFSVPYASITLVDQDRQWFKSCQGIAISETPREIAFCAHAILEDDLLIVEDTLKDPRFSWNPLVRESPFLRFYAGCPFSGPAGHNIGTICISDTRPRTMDEAQKQLLKDLGNWVHLEMTAMTSLRHEIVKTKDELQEKQQMFFRFMEGLPVGVFVLDSNGKPFYANQTAQQLLGKGIIENTGTTELAETYKVFVAGTDHEYPENRMPIVRALNGRSTDVEDLEIHRPDGIIQLQVWATPIFDEHGMITHAIAAFQDITPRKRTERRLYVHSAVSSILSESPTLEEATPKILRAICENVGWHFGAIWKMDPGLNLIRCVDFWHSPAESFPDFENLTLKMMLPVGLGLPGRVWANREPVWITNIVEDSNFPRIPAALKDGLRSAFAFPVCYQNQIIAVTEFFSKLLYEPDEQLLVMLKAMGEQIGQFMGHKQAEEDLLQSRNEYRTLLEKTSH